jgi:hypothetical protein
MNISHSKQNGIPTPSLFQLAAFVEDFFPAGSSSRKPAPALRKSPFADLRRHFQNLKAVVKSTHAQNNASAARLDEAIPVSRTSRRATSRKRKANGTDKLNAQALRELKKVEFCLKAPAADSVKLAADFTDWEKHPVEMMHSPDGFWFTVVPLTLGNYSYRFIVDGEWRDDPRATRRAPNPFGTENAVIQVE